MFHHALDILTIYFKISGNLKKAFVKKTMKLRITKIFLLLCLFTSCSSVHLSCSSGWRSTKEELTKDLVKPKVNYNPSDEVEAAIKGAKLRFVGETDEEDETQGSSQGGNVVATPMTGCWDKEVRYANDAA